MAMKRIALLLIALTFQSVLGQPVLGQVPSGGDTAGSAASKAPPPVTLPVAELAAWTAIGNVLLNLDETITGE